MSERVNAREGICTDCGGVVPVGAGSLWWEADPDDGGDVVGRTPAGWRVTHLDKTACSAVKASAAAERAQRRDEAKAAADEARTRFDAACDVVAAAVRAEIEARGLVRVPEGVTAPIPTGATKVYDGSAYPDGGGFSRGYFGTVWTHGDRAWATLGGGTYPSRWASPEVIADAQRTARICQYWRPGAYSATAYPGPSVPDAELSAEELAKVEGYRAAKAWAEREQAIHGLEVAVDFNRTLKGLASVPGVRVVVPVCDLRSWLAAKLRGEAVPLTLRARATVGPEARDARGKIRTPARKWIPTDPVRLEYCGAVAVAVEVA